MYSMKFFLNSKYNKKPTEWALVSSHLKKKCKRNGQCQLFLMNCLDTNCLPYSQYEWTWPASRKLSPISQCAAATTLNVALVKNITSHVEDVCKNSTPITTCLVCQTPRKKQTQCKVEFSIKYAMPILLYYV